MAYILVACIAINMAAVGYPMLSDREEWGKIMGKTADSTLEAYDYETGSSNENTQIGCQEGGKNALNITLSSTWNHLGVPGSPQNCGRLEVVLSYETKMFPEELFNIKLFKVQGIGYHSCANVDHWPRLTTSLTNQTSLRFNGLQPGNYCVTAVYQLSSYETCMNLTYYSVIKEVSDTFIYINNEVVPLENKLVYILLGIFISMTCIVVLGFIWYQKQQQGKHRTKSSVNLYERISLIEAIEHAPTVKVFLLYYSDCVHHVDVVHHLASFLSCNNCEVSYDVLEKPDIATNKVSWISNKLKGNYKIILINSKMAHNKQQEWLQNKKNSKVEHLTSDVFLGALAIIMNHPEQSFDYNKLLMVRPAYVSRTDVLHDICPGKDYEIPKDLPMLLCNLHDLDVQHIDLNESHLLWSKCSLMYHKLDHLINDFGIRGCACQKCFSYKNENNLCV